MSKLTFAQLEVEAKRRSLIFEHETQRIEGITYRYTITDNATGMEALCETLEEAWSEIYYWTGKEAFQ